MFEAFIPHYSFIPLSSSVPLPLLPSSPLRDDVILIINKCAPQIRPKGRHVSPDGAKIVGGWRGLHEGRRFDTCTWVYPGWRDLSAMFTPPIDQWGKYFESDGNVLNLTINWSCSPLPASQNSRRNEEKERGISAAPSFFNPQRVRLGRRGRRNLITRVTWKQQR